LTALQLADTQLMPMDPRFVILDPLAKANALGTPAVQNAAWRGSADAYRTGQIGNVLGSTWDMSQNVPQHISGTGAGYTANGVNALGATTVNVTGGALGTILAGDIISIAGNTQTYCVASSTGGGTVTAVVINPGLAVATAGGEAITVKASHRCNLLLHRDAIAFAMAPLIEETQIEGVPTNQVTAIDEESGLALRLEVTRQHRQYQWSFDALFGGAVVRPQLGVRIAG
jgi:hypothetical protein